MPTQVTWSFTELERSGIAIQGTDAFCNTVFEILSRGAFEMGSAVVFTLLRTLVTKINDTIDERFALRVTIRETSAPFNSCVAEQYSNALQWPALLLAGNDSARIANLLIYALRVGRLTTLEFARLLRATEDILPNGTVAPEGALPALGITELHVQRWINRQEAFPRSFTGDNALRVANRVRIALSRLLPFSGVGTSSVISWNPQLHSLTLGNGVALAQPPELGLAHQLVRAYLNISGNQLDAVELDPANPALPQRLGRALAVGLGPWSDAVISENQIRRDLAMPVRPMY